MPERPSPPAARPGLRQNVRRSLWRGLRRRCPHCGRGALFKTWFGLHSECSVCHLRFEQRAGDTWAFWLIGDRVFVAVLLIAIVLGFRSTSPWHVLAILGVIAVPLIWTMPHRLGVCVALDYLSRIYMGQPSEIPPPYEEKGEKAPRDSGSRKGSRSGSRADGADDMLTDR